MDDPQGNEQLGEQERALLDADPGYIEWLESLDKHMEVCERCHGTGLVTLHGLYYGGDADDQPCPECK